MCYGGCFSGVNDRKAMSVINGFNIVGNSQARILILGSMPSVRSLQKQQYYAHPRNAFWRIMAALFNANQPLDYEQGQYILQREGIVVWDVLESCQRSGSLDSAIVKDSVVVNDFIGFFESFEHVNDVFFNGGMAECLYKQYVWNDLPVVYKTLHYKKLPSTSPAYAAMSYESKLSHWAVLKSLAQQ